MNGNIIGEPITGVIDDQINHRQQVHGAGYILGTPEIQRTPEVQNYLNNRNCWIKMASGIDLSGSYAIEKLKSISSDEGGYLTDTEIANIQGSGLAENIILFNSTQRFDNASDSYIKRSGVRDGNDLESSISKMYGGLGGNQRGLQPVPGITDISIDCLNRGSIRKATVNIKAYNKFQFGLIELLYLRLGYMVMLEWGWDKYINNITEGSNAITPPIIDIQQMGSTIIENQWFDGNTYSQSDMLNLVSANEERFKGNYGGFFGKVSNFQWKLNSDNTYNITLNLITLGSVIESLNIKVPTINLDKNAILKRKVELAAKLELDLDEKEIEESDNIILTNVGSDRLSQWITDTIINWDSIKTLGSRKKNYVFGGDLAGYDIENNTYKTKWKNNIPKESRYFVRFETFLQVLQEKAIVNVVNGPTSTDSELEFELDSDKVRCNYQTNLVPLNANKVLFSVLMDEQTLEGINGGNNTTNQNQGRPISYFNANLAEFATKEKDVIYGKLLNCYLSLTFIQQSFKNAETDSGDVGLFDFLGSICKGINESTGECTQLEVVVKNDKTVVIIDQNQIKGGDALTKKDDDNTEINIYGYNSNGSSSFVKDFDFQTKITPDLANMVTIGATASKFVTAGKDLGKGLLDGMINGITAGASFTLGLAKDIVNAISGFINDNLIDPFNDLLEFNIPIPFAPDIRIDPPDIPRIKKLAKGGIVTGQQLALLGDNPSGTEAVIPLERAGDMGFGGTTININVQTGVGDPTKIGSEILSYLKQWERMNGSLPISVTS